MGQGNYDYAAASPLLQQALRFPRRPASRECFLADDETLQKNTDFFLLRTPRYRCPVQEIHLNQMKAVFIIPDRLPHTRCQCDLKSLFTPDFG